VINIGLILHQWPIDLGSPYQALMAIKLGLVGLMILIALGNRYILVPMLDAAQPEMLRGLAIGTGTELLLGAAVIGLVSAFATFDPV
jgi:putative copper resistance protein D